MHFLFFFKISFVISVLLFLLLLQVARGHRLGRNSKNPEYSEIIQLIIPHCIIFYASCQLTLWAPVRLLREIQQDSCSAPLLLKKYYRKWRHVYVSLVMCLFDQVAFCKPFPHVFLFLLLSNLDDSSIQRSCSQLMAWHFEHKRHHQKGREQMCVYKEGEEYNRGI